MNITILLEMWQSTIMITGDYRAAIPTWLQYEYVMLGPYLTKSVEGDDLTHLLLRFSYDRKHYDMMTYKLTF